MNTSKSQLPETQLPGTPLPKAQQTGSTQTETQQQDSAAAKKLTIRRFLTPRIVGTAAVLTVALGAGAAAVTRADTSEAKPVEENTIIQRVETIVLELTDDIQQSRTYTGIITARRNTLALNGRPV